MDVNCLPLNIPLTLQTSLNVIMLLACFMAKFCWIGNGSRKKGQTEGEASAKQGSLWFSFAAKSSLLRVLLMVNAVIQWRKEKKKVEKIAYIQINIVTYFVGGWREVVFFFFFFFDKGERERKKRKKKIGEEREAFLCFLNLK